MSKALKKQLKNLPKVFNLMENNQFNLLKLPKNKNHNQIFQASLLRKKELIPKYVDYYIKDPFYYKNPRLFIEFLLRVGELEKLLEITEYLKKKNSQLLPRDFKQFYWISLMQKLDFAHLDAIAGLGELLVAPEYVHEFFLKYSYLSTLDLLETTKSGFHRNSNIFICTNYSHYLSPGPKCTLIPINDTTESAKLEADEYRWADLVSLSYEYNGEQITENAFLENIDDAGLHFQTPVGSKIKDSCRVKVSKIASANSYLNEMETLVKLTQKPISSPVVKYLMGNIELEKNPPTSFNGFNFSQKLNNSQINAIQGAVNQGISLIQGPPGTGKTFTLSHLIKTYSSLSRRPVLVATPTNAATDNVVEYCAREGLNVVRTGDYSSIRPDLKKYSLDSIVQEPLQNYGKAISVLKRSDVICTTAASAGNLLLEKMNFDTVIIDEASQLTETTALVPAACASKNLILIGDHKQLPPNVGYLASRKGFSVSMFSRLAQSIEPLMLSTQYRSHPLIMEFCSKMFYKNELQHGVCHTKRVPPRGFPWKEHHKYGIAPVAFIPLISTENSDNLSKSNLAEAELVLKILRNFIRNGLREQDIGVVSPYAGQNRLLKRLLLVAGYSNVELNSVDGFQGREKEVIIFSATRANERRKVGFLNDFRRFNVMHTRARRGLVVIGNPDTLSADPVWCEWLDWIDDHNLAIEPTLIKN